MTDNINKPAHYTFSSVEPIDVIEAWQLGFHLGNTVKYIARAGRKQDRLEDLRKARWYLDREIARTEAKHASENNSVVVGTVAGSAHRSGSQDQQHEAPEKL